MDVQRLPLVGNLAAGFIKPHNAVGHADFAVSCQARNAENFTLLDVQVNPLDQFAWHQNREISNRQNGLCPGKVPRLCHCTGINATANHQFGQFHWVRILLVKRRNQLSVAHNNDTIGNGDDLVELVADENNADACSCDTGNGFQQSLRFDLGQNSRRLVEDDQLDIFLVNFACAFDELHIAHRHTFYGGPFIEALHAHLIERHTRVGVVLADIQRLKLSAEDAAERIGPCVFTVNFDVFCNREVRKQHKLLMHHADTKLNGFFRGGDSDFFSAQPNAALKAAG